MMIQPGTPAPDFQIPDQNGETVSLSSFRGQKVVLYFYPRDNTPGCSREAAAYRDALPEFEALGVKVFGLSKDSSASHKRFADKYELPFTLLADTETAVLQDYGAWQEKKMYGKVSMGTVRSTVLIDENGVVEKVWPKGQTGRQRRRRPRLLKGAKRHNRGLIPIVRSTQKILKKDFFDKLKTVLPHAKPSFFTFPSNFHPKNRQFFQKRDKSPLTTGENLV